MTIQPQDELVLLWISGDSDVAEKMVFLYAKNSLLQGWWPSVTIVVWGPSARLLASDTSLWGELGSVREAGVKVMACKMCAKQYGVVDTLTELGIEVKYMGEPLTDMIRSGRHVLTV